MYMYLFMDIYDALKFLSDLLEKKTFNAYNFEIIMGYSIG